MRAAIYDEYGDPSVLRVREVDDPPVGPDTVLVRARATSVNPVDWKVRQGHLRAAYPHHLPIVPGWDVAGVVEALGPAVTTGLQVGDEVWGYVRRDDVHLGTTAELVAAPQRTLARKPGRLSFEEAAAVPLAGLTAWQALVDALGVQAGERVLVHAASGGVGHLAVQIAVALGAEVIGTASARNHDHVRALGATTVLDYTAGPVSEQLDGPVDAVLDLVGGEALADAPRQVRDPGRVVSVIDPATVLSLGGRYVFVSPDAEDLDGLAALVDAGRLRVELAATYALEEVAEAHRLSEEGHTRGKIAVRI
ncbi:MAG: Bifunctional protein: zinc-containing alcohol dehydrogenase; quinone oxidoreductase (NADPH:quinone reductase); Similar to arginate lyase [uncultured Nocardioidaceae bacterium]|uniref:Bifunctional protein: zinc-containing alcohol dehydrogenase quinone oxidoreductase ( NADPH:quinone reductase) Similar to arginate lyase n=1 Tax=uncultured Nocardioidaceae bacterium TaxID=253824 RepID=A0A6J4LYC6_9ACTN|nr:MAG: Bifunctional protein: zinc-containing alcohol dehydrogenase; quinone oxidoreductase (NADPH:quinone reductase); Similar to arginate lyase [uncultured Nocardioidaceae bacterium]